MYTVSNFVNIYIQISAIKFKLAAAKNNYTNIWEMTSMVLFYFVAYCEYGNMSIEIFWYTWEYHKNYTYAFSKNNNTSILIFILF